MATEIVTLGDIRAAVKVSDGIRIGGWEPGDPDKPLAEPLQEMADDIIKWFNPDQGWRLTEVRTGFISRQRMAESAEETLSKRMIVNKREPDQFTPNFHFEAETPPTKTVGILRKRVIFDFPHVFTPDFKDRVDIWREGAANIKAAHIGQVYPLEQAVRELSSPYYLVGATVNIASRHPGPSSIIEARQQQEAGIKPEPARGLTVMVYMRDLMDETRIEINNLRRLQRQLDKKFPPLQAAVETPA